MSSYKPPSSPLCRRVATSLRRLEKLETQMKHASRRKRQQIQKRWQRIVDRTDRFIYKACGASWRGGK